MSSLTPSRRTVIRTAAWSVPVVSVATAAPAFAVSPPTKPTFQDVNKRYIFEAQLSGQSLGEVTVDLAATNVPLVVPAGITLPPIQTVSTVTIPENIASVLKSLLLGNPAQVGGTSQSVSTIAGAVNGTSESNLVIDLAPFPSAGPLVTVARGQSAGGVAVPEGASGTAVIELGAPVSNLVGYNADGTPNGRTYQSTLFKLPGNNYEIATFTVA